MSRFCYFVISYTTRFLKRATTPTLLLLGHRSPSCSVDLPLLRSELALQAGSCVTIIVVGKIASEATREPQSGAGLMT